MKKLMLLAFLCIAGVMLVPVASASALTTGTCTLEGPAELVPPLNAELKLTEFTFKNETGKCVESGGKVVGVTLATAKGTGELSCPAGHNIHALNGALFGEGEIQLEGEATPQKFNFELVATAGVVTFTAIGAEVKAAGAAEFLSHTKSVEQCAELKGKHLEFTAVTTGTL